jgi:UDP-N-acetylmuramate dehydrogenase
MDEFGEKMKEEFGERLKENEPMSAHTNFRIGGPARWYLETSSRDELVRAVELSSEHNVRVVIHGGGTNTLYADAGVDALVLVPAMREVTVDGARVVAKACALSSFVARKSADAGLSGLEWMVTIPGTIGGAVRGNAGCFGGETKDKLTEVEVLKVENGACSFARLKTSELKMGYRHSIFKNAEGSGWIILEAVFELERGDAVLVKQALDEMIAKRVASQPANVKSAGCTFKNYDVADDEELARLKSKLELPDAMVKSRRIAAGLIIDQLDLKGKQIGGAKISEAHGNFLVNDASATADQIMQLIAFVKTRARNELGIQLEEEIEFVS